MNTNDYRGMQMQYGGLNSPRRCVCCDDLRVIWYDDGVCDECHESASRPEPWWLRMLRWIAR